MSVATILSAALPSQSSGTLPAFLNPFLKRPNSRRIPSLDVPAKIFVPSVIVIGLSVLLRRVKQGIPRAVVSPFSLPMLLIEIEGCLHNIMDFLRSVPCPYRLFFAVPCRPVNWIAGVYIEPIE